MPYSLEDIRDGVLIPFTPAEIAINTTVTVLTLISLFADVLALYALVKQRYIPLDSRFIISLIFADFCFAVLCANVELINGTYGGWAIGRTGCLIMAILIIVFLGASILSVFSMTAHKYISIVYQWQFSERNVWGMIAATWLVPILLTFLISRALTSSTPFYGLQSSNIYCMLALNSAQKGATLILIFIITTICVLIFGHIHILYKFRQWKIGKEDEDQKKKEGILIKKSVAIAGVFSFTWSFYIFYIIYELSTQTQVPPSYDVFWACLGVVMPILNLFILFQYDAKFKQNMNSLYAKLSILWRREKASPAHVGKNRKIKTSMQKTPGKAFQNATTIRELKLRNGFANQSEMSTTVEMKPSLVFPGEQVYLDTIKMRE